MRTLKPLIRAQSLTLRLLAILLVALGISPLLASSAQASTRIYGAQTGTPAGDGYGYNNVIGTVGVFNHYMTVGNTKVFVYCLNQPLSYNATATYQAVPQTSVTTTAVALADDIAANSSHIGTPLSIPQMEAVAVQLAIWNETSAFNFYVVNNSTITTRAAQLVAGATPLTPSAIGARLTITHVSSPAGSRLHLRLLTSSLQPYAGQSITVHAKGFNHTYVTNKQGIALSALIPTTQRVTATWNGTLSAGTVFSDGNATNQYLVTANPASISRIEAAIVSPTPHTTPKTTTPTAPATTTPTSPTTTAPSTTTTVAPTTTTTAKSATTTLPTTTTTLPTTTTTTLPLATTKGSKMIWWFIIIALIIIIFLIWRERQARRDDR